MDKVQQLTVMTPQIDLRTEDLSNLKLWLTIYKDRWQRQLDSVSDCVRGCGFQYRDMEYWMDSTEVIQKLKGDQMGARLHYNLIGPKNLSASFLEGCIVRKNCTLMKAQLLSGNSGAGRWRASVVPCHQSWVAAMVFL